MWFVMQYEVESENLLNVNLFVNRNKKKYIEIS
jgi:hypothetical protein